MGRLTPPTVVRVSDKEAILPLNQVIKAMRELGNAAKMITGDIEATVPEKRPHVCSQCGAPLHGDHCEYCNTLYK